MNLEPFLHLTATLFALCIFLKGFFPVKNISKDNQSYKLELDVDLDLDLDVNLKGAQAKHQSKISSKAKTSRQISGSNTAHPIHAHRHPRVILMIIDAFREDFAYGPLRFMPLTHDILNAGNGLKFTAETMPPTVTLPRIKALVTGSTSSFADVVLNFGSSALEEDNVVSQMKANNYSVVFYGDDTWLRLFPNHFERSDGTTSFFVSDYTEVDHNVTRHLWSELENPKWDVMILHYLGLDHIGHIAGPRSPLIGPKLAEMDGVIQQIYSAMEQWDEPSVLVVCGDHGMSDQGGHGGASPGEISVPVLFLSPQISNRDPKHSGTISQTDLCPTLSVLLGLPIPSNNIGKVVTDALMGYSVQQKVAILHHNARQAMRMLKSCVSDLQKESAYLLFQQAEQKLRRWYKSKNNSDIEHWENQGQDLLTIYSESLSLISEKVSKLSTQYDVYAMAIAIVLTWMIFVSLLFSYIQQKESNRKWHVSRLIPVIGSGILSHIIMCTGGVPSNLVCSPAFPSVAVQTGIAVTFVFLALQILNKLPSLETLIKQFKTWRASTSMVEALLLVGTTAHTFTLLSSSFVEEEHQTFFYLATAVHLLILYRLVVQYAAGFGNAPFYRDAGAGQLEGKVWESVSGLNDGGRCDSEPGSAASKTEEVSIQGYVNNSDDSSDEGRVSDDHLRWSESISTANSANTFHTESLSSVADDFGNTEDRHSLPETDLGEHTHYHQHREINTLGERTTQTSRRKTEKDYENYQRGSSEVQKRSSLRDFGAAVKPCMSLTDFLHWAFSLVAVLAMLRVLRRWNHTGNKWLDIPDFGDWLVKPENKGVLSMLTVFSFMIIGASRGQHLRRVQTMFVNLALCCAYLSRVSQGTLFFPVSWFLSSSGVVEARASYLFIALTCLTSMLPENFLKLEKDSEKKLQTQPTRLKSLASASPHKSISSSSKRSTDRRDLMGDSLSNTIQTLSSSDNSRTVPAKKASKAKSLSRSDIGNLRNDSNSSLIVREGDSKSRAVSGEVGDDRFSMQKRLRGIMAAAICFCCLVKQPHSAPVVAMMSLTEQMMTPVLIQTALRPVYAMLYCVWMGQVFFFLQGNSNSLSTVDIAAGYVGLDGYWPEVNGLVLFVTTYISTLFWGLAFLSFLCQAKSQLCNHGVSLNLTSAADRYCTALLLTRVLPLSVYTALVAAQRYHLFVWTVFSPKLLYEAAHTAVVGVQLLLLLAFEAFMS